MQIKLFTLPNLLTLGNLLCGSVAAVAALVYGDLTLAFWLVVAAVVLDFFDGFAARLLGQSSPLGVELDSLADMVTSGLVPACVLFVLFEGAPGLEGWNADWTLAAQLSVFVLTAFSALRLARFNIDDTQHTEFRGLPTPAAALFCVSLGLLWAEAGFVVGRVWLVAIACVLAALLVSPIRMFALKFKGFGWRGNELRYLFLAGSAGLLVGFGPGALAGIILLYIVISTVRWLVVRKRADGDPSVEELHN